jgi:8-oxo-dGTP diphosphatase
VSERLKVFVAVFVLVIKDGKVLLIKRANTGWIDGYYDAPAGGLEPDEPLREGASRELFEETSLIVSPEDLQLVHIARSNINMETPYIDFLFLAHKWYGEPKIMEPDKCDDMRFFSIDKLPEKTGPFTQEAIKNLKSKELTFSFHAPGSFKE